MDNAAPPGILASMEAQAEAIPLTHAPRAKPGAGKPDWSALYFAGLAAFVLCVSFWFSRGNLPHIETCGFKVHTGLPCPGCGLTRGFCAISRGAWADAWNFNPFAFPLYVATLFLILRPALRWSSGYRALEQWVMAGPWFGRVMLTGSITLVVYGLLRICYYLFLHRGQIPL
jgi:hypothetical protein